MGGEGQLRLALRGRISSDTGYEKRGEWLSMTTHEDQLKRLYLVQELDLSVNSVKSGLAILQRSRPYKTQHFLFLLVLSTGFERLMKVLLCLRSFNDAGQFLSEKALRKYGHDLMILRDDVYRDCFPEHISLPEVVEEDRDFMLNDPLLNAVLRVLSDFAVRDRYLYMNGINNPVAQGEWLDQRWEEVEAMTASKEERLRMVTEDRLDELKNQAIGSIMVCLERFLRALVRTTTHTGLQGKARSMGTGIWDFLTMQDEQLGQKRYEIINT